MASDGASPGAPPSIVIAGAGSIGCFVGGLLAAAGRRVTLLGRPRIAAEIRAHGLTLTDLDGMASRVDPEALTLATDPACLGDADLVLVAVKSRDTARMARTIAHEAPAAAPVVSLQNGVANAAILSRACPGRDVRAGMVGFNVVPLGQGCFHRATEGEMVIAAGPTDLAAQLAVPGLPCTSRADMEALQWGKLLLNLNNALNALSGLPLREQLSDRAWRRLMADQWAEALRVLRAAGIAPVSFTPVPVGALPTVLRLPDVVFKRLASRMLAIDPQARTSMSYDLMAGKPTEIDALQGAIVEKGAALGVPTPINAMVMDVVKSAELAGQGLPNLPAHSLRAELRRMRDGEDEGDPASRSTH